MLQSMPDPRLPRLEDNAIDTLLLPPERVTTEVTCEDTTARA